MLVLLELAETTHESHDSLKIFSATASSLTLATLIQSTKPKKKIPQKRRSLFDAILGGRYL
jgi:hypothetical protein